MSAVEGINYLPSWKNATDPSDGPALRVLAEDGTLHFSDLKKLAQGLSGRQYLQAVNNPGEPSAAMLLGTAVHLHVLGPRPGAKRVTYFPGARRQGKEWDAFKALNLDAEILMADAWQTSLEIAAAVKRDPTAQRRLEGARFEVPLEWEDGGFRCSTSGVDIVSAGALADLKTTPTTCPDMWTRHALKMLYHCQMAWYRRGARANGIDFTRGLYLLGVETKPPYEVVELDLNEDPAVLDCADRTLSIWLEKLRALVLECPSPAHVEDWPGYAQRSIAVVLPSHLRTDEDDEDETEAAA